MKWNSLHGRIQGGGGQGVWTPPFVPRCRLFNIGPKIGPPSGPPFLLVDLIWTPPPFKNPGPAPGLVGQLLLNCWCCIGGCRSSHQFYEFLGQGSRGSITCLCFQLGRLVLIAHFPRVRIISSISLRTD